MTENSKQKIIGKVHFRQIHGVVIEFRIFYPPWIHGFSDYSNTAQKMKFSIKDFFSKCDQIRSFLRIWSHLLKQSLMENFIFCAV